MAKRKVADEELVETDEAAVPEPTAEEIAVAETKARVDEAKRVLDEASADHKDAVAAHEAATRGPEPQPGQHIVVDGMTYDAPEGWDTERPRRLTINGRNVEHTHDTDSGVWCYRSM